MSKSFWAASIARIGSPRSRLICFGVRQKRSRVIPSTKADVIIENNVWFGTDSLILSGVRVGNGAVIGAGSVVTKDIPPYAILAGNPAKIIRYRFDSETIDELLKIKWWEWEDKKIGEFLPDLMNGDIKQFINKSNKLS